MRSFMERMTGAARLEASVYEEVEADRGATGQAMAVIALSSVAAGIGGGATHGIGGLLIGTIGALLAWAVWAALIYLIGAKLLPEPGTRADVGELLRTIGFASAPGILRLLGFIPVLRGLVFLVTGIWMLAATVVAVRQALDYESTGRAIIVCGIGWVVQVVVLLLLFSIGR